MNKLKIDLHIHNKKTCDGDGEERNVSPEDFRKYLIESKVAIAAITNHNYFGSDVYDEYIDPNYLLLPGMEIDIIESEPKTEYLNKKNRSQLNIIFSDECAKYLIEIYENNFSNLKEGLIDEKDFFRIFLSENKCEKFLIYLDNKRNETHISERLTQKIKEKFKNIPVIHDVPSIKNYNILESNDKDIVILIGSDVKKWTDYVKDSSKLLDFRFKIRTFDQLFSILLNKKSSKEITKIIDIEFKKINIKINDSVNFDIKILQKGLNLISGDKATGKSKILKGIEEELKAENISYSFFDREISQKEFNKLKNPKKILDENIVINEDIKTKITSLCDLISKRNKIKIDTPGDFQEFSMQKINENFKIQDTEVSDIANIYEQISVIKKIDEFKYIINNFDIESLKTLELSDEIAKFLELLHTFKLNIFRKFILKNKILISKEMTFKIILKVRALLRNNKRIFTNQLVVGLLEKFNWEKEVINKKNYIKNIKISNSVKILDEFYLDDDSEKIEYIQNDEIIKFDKKNSCKENRNYSDWNKIAIPFFKSEKFREKEWDDFVKFWKEKQIEMIISKSIFRNKYGSQIELSSGQQDLFILIKTLDQDKKYYLLDEPCVYLGSNSVLGAFRDSISKLKMENKTIVISTHNPSLGINSMPDFYIYRKKSEEGQYITYDALIDKDRFINIMDETDIVDKDDTLWKIFEGSEKAYVFRKAFYRKN